jgi:hypothetical protein
VSPSFILPFLRISLRQTRRNFYHRIFLTAMSKTVIKPLSFAALVNARRVFAGDWLGGWRWNLTAMSNKFFFNYFFSTYLTLRLYLFVSCRWMGGDPFSEAADPRSVSVVRVREYAQWDWRGAERSRQKQKNMHMHVFLFLP